MLANGLQGVAALLVMAGVGNAQAQAQAPEAASWELVWADEFEGDAIDPSRWDYDLDCWGGGNNERQCYTDRPENAHVAGGMLSIIARHERARGPAEPLSWHPDGDVDLVTRDFTSARLVTRGLAAWRYGRIEVRALLPGGQGVWPAIWMLPEDQAYGGWAASGEIDIMEAVNLGTECPECSQGREDRVLGTLHYGGVWPENVHTGSPVHVPDLTAGFHTFSIEWAPGVIHWFVDDQLYATQTSADWYSATAGEDRPHAPFDQRFHLLLNLAIGGNWPETTNERGVSESGFPKTFSIDFVRVYACSAGEPETAACLTRVE